jgi:hypothetical protein
VRRFKHPIATPFALLSLTTGITCILVNKMTYGPHPSVPTPLGWTGTALVAVALLTPLWVALFRLVHRCYREVMDCVWIVRRGVLNPIQLREEFIETMGREPTIAEVHDLLEMIQSEYNQAILTLGAVVGGAVIGARAVRGKPLLQRAAINLLPPRTRP